MKARIEIEKSPETGHLYAKSQDIKGFHAHGADFESLSRSVVDVIRLIHTLNETEIGDITLSFSPEALDWAANKAELFVEYEVRQDIAA